jgi:hypothetical protein
MQTSARNHVYLLTPSVDIDPELMIRTHDIRFEWKQSNGLVPRADTRQLRAR